MRPAISASGSRSTFGVGIERQQEVPAPLGVFLERRDLARQERARRTEHDDDGGVLGDLVAEALREPEVLDRVVLRLEELAHAVGGAALGGRSTRSSRRGPVVRYAVRVSREHLEQGLLEVAVERLELAARGFHLDAEVQRLLCRPAGEHDARRPG